MMTSWDRAVRLLDLQPAAPPVGVVRRLGEDAIAVLRRLVEELALKDLIECGPGHSTIRLADLPLVSYVALEHDETHHAELRGRLEAAGLASRVTLHHAAIRWCRRGPFVGRGYGLPELGRTFDLALIDGPPSRLVGRLMTLPLLWPHLRVGALALLDDANRADAERRVLHGWAEAYGDAVRIQVFPRFAKGLALVEKRVADPAVRAWPALRASVGELVSTERSRRRRQWEALRGR